MSLHVSEGSEGGLRKWGIGHIGPKTSVKLLRPVTHPRRGKNRTDVEHNNLASTGPIPQRSLDALQWRLIPYWPKVSAGTLFGSKNGSFNASHLRKARKLSACVTARMGKGTPFEPAPVWSNIQREGYSRNTACGPMRKTGMRILRDLGARAEPGNAEERQLPSERLKARQDDGVI
jgi:hypothetical protein